MGWSCNVKVHPISPRKCGIWHRWLRSLQSAVKHTPLWRFWFRIVAGLQVNYLEMARYVFVCVSVF